MTDIIEYECPRCAAGEEWRDNLRAALHAYRGAAPRAEGLLPRCPECGFMGRKGVWHAEGCPQAAPRAEGPSRWDVREAYERGYAEGQRALTDEEDEPMDHHEVNALAYRAGKAIGGALSAGRKEQLHTIEGAAPRAEGLPEHLRGDGPCGDCGTLDNIGWFTDNVLWNRVTGEHVVHEQPRSGILCIPCFVKRADAVGLHPTGWRLLPDWPWRERPESTRRPSDERATESEASHE